MKSEARNFFVRLIFATGQSVPGEDSDKAADNEVMEGSRETLQYRLPGHVVPLHYDVRLIPHIVEDNFTTDGEASIDVQVREPTNTIAMHIMNIIMDEGWTRLIRKSEEEDVNSVQTHVPQQHHYDDRTQILSIRFEKMLDVGVYTLHLKFAGILANNTRGFYRTFYTNDDGNKV